MKSLEYLIAISIAAAFVLSSIYIVDFSYNQFRKEFIKEYGKFVTFEILKTIEDLRTIKSMYSSGYARYLIELPLAAEVTCYNSTIKVYDYKRNITYNLSLCNIVSKNIKIEYYWNGTKEFIRISTG